MATPENSDSNVFDLQELSRQAAVELPEPEPKRFKLERLEDLLAEPEPEFAVHGLLKRGDLTLAYGPAKSYKTFAMIDLIAMVLRGSGLFAGQFEVTQQWRVVYVSNEGRRFLRYRLTGARDYHGLGTEDVDNLRVIRNVPNLYNGDGVEDLIELVRTFEPDLIVFDTLARVTVGADENTTQSMGQVLENVEHIQEALGGPAVLFIHHANKSGDIRGTTLLKGAADTILKFDIQGPGRASMRTDGVKDGAEFDQIQFTTVAVGESRCRAVEWLGADSNQSKGDATLTHGQIISYLRETCQDPAGAATVSDISAGTSISKPTVLKHLRQSKFDNSPLTINGVRSMLKTMPRANKPVEHWYWDSAFTESRD